MSNWTFITNHGAVLALIGQRGQITGREIAIELDITERTVMRIIRDLETAGYIQRRREGRLNRYEVNCQAPLRRQDIRDAFVGKLLSVLYNDG